MFSWRSIIRIFTVGLTYGTLSRHPARSDRWIFGKPLRRAPAMMGSGLITPCHAKFLPQNSWYKKTFNTRWKHGRNLVNPGKSRGRIKKNTHCLAGIYRNGGRMINRFIHSTPPPPPPPPAETLLFNSPQKILKLFFRQRLHSSWYMMEATKSNQVRKYIYLFVYN